MIFVHTTANNNLFLLYNNIISVFSLFLDEDNVFLLLGTGLLLFSCCCNLLRRLGDGNVRVRRRRLGLIGGGTLLREVSYYWAAALVYQSHSSQGGITLTPLLLGRFSLFNITTSI